ncbi:MAG: cytochrome c-type biogenesis protein CcmH [Chloroflexota bacterium]|nr:cytochrome c-type biogenesis protein CcmH [Chloroflexota bacterium]MDE2941031.1 cytochrome c-type biogenesis protein CcmH [Chloroflexota bacterium]MDE3268201.1 cytochrome c-type biogenesis protein CcmH [Chloroflexota bacterium]
MTTKTGRAIFARLMLPVMLLALFAVVSACATQAASPGPQDLEAEAQGIDQSLMCPICPSETIDQSQTEIAEQMRRTVRERLAQGESRDEVLDFFVERYGEGILAAPPKSGFNLLAWLVPPIALLIGGSALALVVRSMRQEHRRSAAAPLPGAAGLEQYLAAVDQDIRGLTADDGGERGKDQQPNG